MSAEARFAAKDRAVLAFLAASFSSTMSSHSAEFAVEHLLSVCPALREDYIEVDLLAILMALRRRARQSVVNADEAAFAALPGLLDEAYALVPDKALALLAGLIRSQEGVRGEQLRCEQSTAAKIVLAVFLVGAQLQKEVLRATSSLTVRSGVIHFDLSALPFLL
jgi:hypothetical protein